VMQLSLKMNPFRSASLLEKRFEELDLQLIRKNNPI